MFFLLLLFLTSILAEEQIFSIQLPHDISAEDFAREHRLTHLHHIAGYDVFENKRTRMSRSLRSVENLFVDQKKKLYKRYYRNAVTDPMYPMQWHLHGTRNGVDALDSHTGKGINIAIVDDGVQHNHEDLKSNFQSSLSWDYNNNRNDVNPINDNGHGTSCAGVAAAARNSVCGRGVAYEAGIVGIKLIEKNVYDYQEAQALSHRNDHIRIYSNSWGPQDDGYRLSGPGPVTQAVLKHGFESGKNIFVWAGGNGARSPDNSNYDGYANSPYTIAIAASDFAGHRAWYSEKGANIFAAAPSSGYHNKGIITTDLEGPHGYAPGNCATEFGGTSSSAPLAAGIIALMLQERPDLTARDVMHIIAHKKKHSHNLGFGILKVPELLERTRSHRNVEPQQKKIAMRDIELNQRIPKGIRWLEHKIHIKAAYHLQFIEQVLVTVTMKHGYRGQVQIRLASPVAESILAEHRGDRHSGTSTWTYSSVHHWGEVLNQGDVWTFKIRDDTYNSYRGEILKISVEWWGI